MTYPATAPSQNNLMGMSPSPSTMGDRPKSQKAKDIEKYVSVLAQYRLLWEPMIDNLIAYVNHGRRSVQDKDLWPGQPTGQFIYDDTAMLAKNMARDGMVGYLCSRNQPWFALEIPTKFMAPRTSSMRTFAGRRIDSFPAVARWLQDCQDGMYAAFNRSNFYDVVTEFIGDGISIGTAYMLIEEEVAYSRLAFTVPHFRECFIAENRYGKVDTVYRVYKITLRQAADKFGYDNLCKIDNGFKKKYESNMHEETEVLHAVYPRTDYIPWRIDSRGKQWESDWLYRKGGKILNQMAAIGRNQDDSKIAMEEGGYDSMPWIVWRWRKNNDETYGRGAGHDAWISIALSNQMGRTNLKTAQRAAEPPLVAYSDLRGQIQKDADGITFMEQNRGDLRSRMPQPLFSGANELPFNIEYQDRVARVINQHFHTDVFMLLTQLAQAKASERMVTEQIFELMNEKAAILGTRVGNLQSEAFDPLVGRVFSVESRAGRIPPPPDILLENLHAGVQVQYLGPLAQAQTRLSKIRSMQTGIQLTKMAVETLGPQCTDWIDDGETMKDLYDACGFPAKDIRDDKMVMQIRQSRLQKEQQQQQIDAIPKLAKAAQAMGKGVEDGSPLKAMFGGADGE